MKYFLQLICGLCVINSMIAEQNWSYQCDPKHQLIDTCNLEINEAKDAAENGKFLNIDDFKNVKIINIWHSEFIPSNILTTFPLVEFLSIKTNASDIANNLFDGGEKVEFFSMSSNIDTLKCEPFVAMKNLVSLILETKINKIENDAIKCLPKLRDLSLLGNQLTEINNKMFAGANQLRGLNLQRNHIESIESGSFDLPLLSYIDLSHNKISSISSNLFTGAPKLVNINLEVNLLENINFELPKKLEAFKISHNPIKVAIDVTRFVYPLENLDDFSLQNTTSMIQFSRTFDSTFNLTRIDISYNNLNDSDILRHLKVFPNLKTIDIEGNNFKEINELKDVEIFFTKLRYFDIRCNEFECGWLESQISNYTNIEFDSVDLDDTDKCFGLKNYKGKVKEVDCI